MRHITWNYRGFGNPRAVRALCELVKKESPHVVFLSQTKLHVKELDKVRRKCGLNGCFGVSAKGRSGGLAIIWKEEIRLQVISFS